jgi:tetratricopeptide (TPR) repeat protein
MKKLALLISGLLLSNIVLSQTQQGYVRTLGRPDKKGEALEGVVVRIKGEHNAILSDKEGSFFMLLHGLSNGVSYSLQQVQKTGYELNETDLIGRQLAFSDKVPLTIVMVSTTQLQADIQRIENSAYKTAEKNYNTKIEQLEKQKDDNRITIAQYQVKIQDLHDKFEKYQLLIEGLAEHYAHTDYDLLSEKDREINICIENGELERADSLIHLLFDPINVLERNKEALASLDQQIDEAHQLLDQANDDMAAVLKQQEKDAEYLYQLYTIALGRYDYDKAQYYIETRASLDTTNAEWQLDAGLFLSNQKQSIAAETYFLKALGTYRFLAQNNPQTYEPQLATTLYYLGCNYGDIHRARECENCLLESFEISKRLCNGHPQLYDLILSTKKGLMRVYYETNQFDKYSETGDEVMETLNVIQSDTIIQKEIKPSTIRSLINIFLNALNIPGITKNHIKQLSDNGLFSYFEALNKMDENDIYSQISIGYSLKNIAILYNKIGLEKESESLFKTAVNIFRTLSETNPQAFEPDLANALTDLAILYLFQKPTESEALLLEALDIHERQSKNNPLLPNERKAYTTNALSALYSTIGKDDECESLYLETLKTYEALSKETPEALSNVASTARELASFYSQHRRFHESETYYMQAVQIYQTLSKESPLQYNSYLAETLIEMANCHGNLRNYNECESNLKEAVEIYRDLIKNNPTLDFETYLAKATKELALLYYQTQNYEESELLLLESLETCRRLNLDETDDYKPLVATIKNTLAKIYGITNRNQESEKMFQESIAIDRYLTENISDSFEPALAIDLLDYAQLKTAENHFKEAIALVEECLDIMERIIKNKSDSFVVSIIADHIIALQLAGELYSNTMEYQKASHYYQDAIALLRNKNDQFYQEDLVNALGNLSYCSLYIHDFGNAEQYAYEALTIDPSQQWIFTNLAAALLFQGKYDEAEEIYRNMKKELKENFLQDFIDYEAAGVIPKERKADAERIKKMLNE